MTLNGQQIARVATSFDLDSSLEREQKCFVERIEKASIKKI